MKLIRKCNKCFRVQRCEVLLQHYYQMPCARTMRKASKVVMPSHAIWGTNALTITYVNGYNNIHKGKQRCFQLSVIYNHKRTRFFGIAQLNCGSIEILNIFNERNILRQIPLKHNNSTIKPLLATKLHEAFSNKKTDAKQDHFPMQMELGWCKIITFLVTP